MTITKTKNKLEAIILKYSSAVHNSENFNIGGGLVDSKFASRRHEDAKADFGKLTLGEASQLFKKATGLDIKLIKELINFKFPFLEWHHAGILPKSFGGGMKKTYFLNSAQISELALDWFGNFKKFEITQAFIAKSNILAAEKALNMNNYLELNAKFLKRVPIKPNWFYLTCSECDGKYGWFDAEDNKYGLKEYFSGWEFYSFESYKEFYIKFL